MPKLCEFETCRKRATYGKTNKPVNCKEHKTNEMKLSCHLCDCGKAIPTYNIEGLNAEYCVLCKTSVMVDVANKRCHCGKARPIYNIEGLKPNYCILCKTNDMMDVANKRCHCGKAMPIYNIQGLKAEYCILCKTSDMMDVANKRCHCGKAIPIYNIQGLKAEYCVLCKTTEMINVVSKKCHCGKAIPIYNIQGLKAEYCVLCKTTEMTDVAHKKCKCGKAIPTYNYKGLKREYCATCKNDYMIDVVHHTCKAVSCETQGNKNYKGYCTNCFQNLFPLDPLTFQIRSKTKEIAVRDFINAKFEGFQHDKSIWYNETVCDCTTKRRIDHRKLINDTLLCIETDENQHKSYSKTDEEARYNDIFMAFGGKFIFIRFNPDKYKDKNGKSCNPMLVNRLPILEDEINKQIKRIETGENTELLEVIEIYYDKSI
jgi:hypothetical protein